MGCDSADIPWRKQSRLKLVEWQTELQILHRAAGSAYNVRTPFDHTQFDTEHFV